MFHAISVLCTTVTDGTQSKIHDRYHQIKTARLKKKTQKEILVHTISYPKNQKRETPEKIELIRKRETIMKKNITLS